MNKQKPILFSTPMVKAILQGTKTQTRREIKSRSSEDSALLMNLYTGARLEESKNEMLRCRCPYGEVGDVIWVRETFVHGYKVDGGDILTTDDGDLDFQFWYKATSPNLQWMDENGRMSNKVPWKPCIHMPKDACRLFLEITDIRVERLQDISVYDAVEEGIKYWNVDLTTEKGALHADYENYTWRDDPSYKDYHFPTYTDPISSFQSLWESINGPESWNDNPWVWAITFKKSNLQHEKSKV